jgi:Zn-dependent membrane protease YugP
VFLVLCFVALLFFDLGACFSSSASCVMCLGLVVFAFFVMFVLPVDESAAGGTCARTHKNIDKQQIIRSWEARGEFTIQRMKSASSRLPSMIHLCTRLRCGFVFD